MSYSPHAIKAAHSAVIAPIHATTCRALPESSKIGEKRATTYTPAVTIVAAWINAETGVGPSMASGSHTYRGICALLAVAPARNRSAAIVTVPDPRCTSGPREWNV